MEDLLVTEKVNEGAPAVAVENKTSAEFPGREVTVKPNHFNGKLGKNAEVSVPLKSVVPLQPIKNKYPNTYKQMRCKFIVSGIREFEMGKDEKRKWTMFLMFKWKNEAEKPEGGQATNWKCNFRLCRLERAGPPNQFFFESNKSGNRLISQRQQPVGPWGQQPVLGGDNGVDSESGVEDNVEENPHIENNNDPYSITWDPNFINNITIDQRGCADKINAHLKGCRNVEAHELTRLALFNLFAPTEYFLTELIPATNECLVQRGFKKLMLGEWECWIGIWMLLQLHPGYQADNLFSSKSRTMYWNPPFIGSVISGNGFCSICECIMLRDLKDASEHRDKFWWVRELLDAFNRNMERIFCPS